MELLEEFGLETYKHFDTGKKFWQLPNGSIKSYSGKIPPLPYTSLVDILRYFNKVRLSSINFIIIASIKFKMKYQYLLHILGMPLCIYMAC